MVFKNSRSSLSHAEFVEEAIQDLAESGCVVANLDLSSHLPLFRPLTKNKSGYTLRNGKLSYTRCREIFKTTLKDLGYDPKEYGLHSLRSGGATAVISNNASKAVSERLLKLHGRWKTDEAKDMYVLETECNRLSVTKYLGI